MIAQLTHLLIEYLNSISKIIPLPWFSFFGSMIEEVIAPIPSPLVMTLAGSIAAKNDHSYIYISMVAVIGALGKTIASYIMYIIADKFEDVVLNKFGKFLGVSHKEIEQIGKRLNKGWKDDIVLALLRAIPIIPSAPVSIVSGLIKINVRTFITSTFIGTVIRNFIYMMIGFTGVNATESLIVRMEDLEIVGYIVILILFIMIGGYIFYNKNKDAVFNRIFTKKD